MRDPGEVVRGEYIKLSEMVLTRDVKSFTDYMNLNRISWDTKERLLRDFNRAGIMPGTKNAAGVIVSNDIYTLELLAHKLGISVDDLFIILGDTLPGWREKARKDELNRSKACNSTGLQQRAGQRKANPRRASRYPLQSREK